MRPTISAGSRTNRVPAKDIAAAFRRASIQMKAKGRRNKEYNEQ